MPAISADTVALPRALDPFVHMDQMGEVDYAPASPSGRPGTPTAGSRRSPGKGIGGTRAQV